MNYELSTKSVRCWEVQRMAVMITSFYDNARAQLECTATQRSQGGHGTRTAQMHSNTKVTWWSRYRCQIVIGFSAASCTKDVREAFHFFSG